MAIAALQVLSVIVGQEVENKELRGEEQGKTAERTSGKGRPKRRKGRRKTVGEEEQVGLLMNTEDELAGNEAEGSCELSSTSEVSRLCFDQGNMKRLN